MLKKVMAALLAATAAVFPVAASAQDGNAERRQLERGGDDNPAFARRAEAREARAERRAERQAERPASRPERPADQPRPSRPERQADQPRPAAERQARGGWQGRGDWGQRRAEAAAAQQAQPQRDWGQGDRSRRDRNRGQAVAGTPQADWRRNAGRTPPAVQQRRDDDRRAQSAQRWGDSNGWNNGRRWDGDQRWDGDRRDDRRWDNNGRNNARWTDNRRAGWSWNNGRTDWSRRWRDDNRYDWGRYRQQNRALYRLPRYYAPYDWNYGYRRFAIGVSLSQPLWAEDYWIGDPWSYRLPPADGPYRWVRYYNDALLVDLRSGEVVDTVYDIFY